MTFDWHWPAFFTRVTAGLLFAMAGIYKVFIMTPQVHARNLFLEPYHTPGFHISCCGHWAWGFLL